MPGPLPTGDAVRRNKPTIPTTSLPAAGRSTPAPDVPLHYDLGSKGADWWAWAWRTPQACAWDDGALFVVARRAQLEDDLDALESDPISDALYAEAGEVAATVGEIIRKLKALAGGKLAIAREMRELDDRLGLTPKGLAALRWKIVDDTETEGKSGAGQPKRGGSRRLKAV